MHRFAIVLVVVLIVGWVFLSIFGAWADPGTSGQKAPCLPRHDRCGQQRQALLPTGDQESVLWPQFLPDGRHFLFVATSIQPEQAGIYVGSLDSDERRQINATRSYALYAPSGHLLFIQDGTLVAQRFDIDTFRTTALPVPVADQVWLNLGTGRGMFSISNDGR